MPNIQLIVAAVIFMIVAGLATTTYVLYQSNSTKSAQIAQQSQALSVQEKTINSLTAQAAEIAAKHQQLNAAYALAEQRLQQRTRSLAPAVGEPDTAIHDLGAAIEGGGR